MTVADKTWHPVALTYLSEIVFRQGRQETAFDYLHQVIKLNRLSNDRNTNVDAYKIIASFFRTLNKPDSSIYYARKGLLDSQEIRYKLGVLEISKLLADQYLKKDVKLAHHYLQMVMTTNDELYGGKRVQDLQKVITDEQQRVGKAEVARLAYQNRIKQYALLAGIGIMFLIGSLLYRNNHQKQLTNIALKEQKERVEAALSKLKSTQDQLIQKEKMASLGELTAGIAHEIQNPLNFVNNFSEVSTELVGELKDELNRGDTTEAKAIADGLTQNLQKITLHGGRASAIVKGMFKHSRTSTGQRELTDINALCEEYLRLAYHGLKAKDKTFTCKLITEFVPNLGQVDVVPQEIGRVLLNLFNNAFYAVQQKQKLTPADYQPRVMVSTKQLDNQSDRRAVEICVADNGTGIPEAVKAKIFQPFFTTKPTGEGTGLGLSLSYDIVTKGHGGKLTVESTEGEGAEFVLMLPT